MNADSVVQKLEQLPEQLRAEAEDFIDFLFAKAHKGQNEKDIRKGYGSWKGQIEMRDDFDAPLEEDFKDTDYPDVGK